MKYSVFFGFATLGVLAIGVSLRPHGLGFAWPAFCLACLSIAYATNSSHIFGKRKSGELLATRVFLFAPWLAFTSLTAVLLRSFSREPPMSLCGDLLLGRRVTEHELPEGIHDVIDLTAEFSEPRGIRSRRGYRSLPILDARSPPAEVLLDFLQPLVNVGGPIFIHCAQGHGRTGLVAAALLLLRQHASSPAEAIATLQEVRPRIRLNTEQQKCLMRFADLLQERSPSSGEQSMAAEPSGDWPQAAIPSGTCSAS